jgi:hypothetical protein
MGATSSDGIATAIPIPKIIVAMATKYVNFILVLYLGILIEEGKLIIGICLIGKSWGVNLRISYREKASLYIFEE